MCKRDREEQLDIYRQKESVQSFKEVLFPLNTDSFRLHFTLPDKVFVFGARPLGCMSQSGALRWISHHQQVCRVKCNPYSRRASAVVIKQFLCTHFNF